MTADSLQSLLDQLDVPHDPDAGRRLQVHHELLLAWNAAAHLVSSGDAGMAALLRHDREALQALPYLAPHRQLLDIGTGGGYPGLIWACCLPEAELTLVEANRRKVAFLRQAIHDLGLKKVTVVPRRMETPAQVAASGTTLWTSRAAGCSDLLLEAAGMPSSTAPTLVLYLGADKAAALDLHHLAGRHCAADLPLASGASGRLVVLAAASSS